MTPPNPFDPRDLHDSYARLTADLRLDQARN